MVAVWRYSFKVTVDIWLDSSNSHKHRHKKSCGSLCATHNSSLDNAHPKRSAVRSLANCRIALEGLLFAYNN